MEKVKWQLIVDLCQRIAIEDQLTRMGNEAGKPSELMGSTEPVTNFGINIKQPDKLHLVRSW